MNNFTKALFIALTIVMMSDNSKADSLAPRFILETLSKDPFRADGSAYTRYEGECVEKCRKANRSVTHIPEGYLPNGKGTLNFEATSGGGVIVYCACHYESIVINIP